MGRRLICLKLPRTSKDKAMCRQHLKGGGSIHLPAAPSPRNQPKSTQGVRACPKG